MKINLFVDNYYGTNKPTIATQHLVSYTAITTFKLTSLTNVDMLPSDFSRG